MAIGAVQIGLMYIAYYESFLILTVPEILLFTVFTPIYVTLLNDALAGRFSPFYLLTASLAVIGAMVLNYHGVNDDFWKGFMMVQGSNICFAIGQVAYRQLMARVKLDVSPFHNFGWFYIGALILVLPAFLLFGDMSKPATTPLQWGILLWLGVVASGLGYYFWNQGACKVDAGTLAIMNDMLKPAGLAVNLLIWNHDADLPRLALSSAIIICALVLNAWWTRRQTASRLAAKIS